MDIKDKVVVITGIGTGLGRSLAQDFAKSGAKVAGISRTEADLVETAKSCPGLVWHAGDVSKAEDVDALFEKTEAALGPVDVLINNAAVYPREFFVDQSMDDFEKALLVNVMGVARTCHRALPNMLERRFGRIVNIGSYAFVAPIPRAAVYSASKGAVSSLTRALASEVDAEKFPDVRINELMPGQFDTRMGISSGEPPDNVFGYTLPVVTVPKGGPHGRIFLKGELQDDGSDGGLKAKIKRAVKKFLPL